MKSNQPTKSGLPENALTEKELDKVSAGGTKKDEAPKESISLNFTEVKFTYTSQ